MSLTSMDSLVNALFRGFRLLQNIIIMPKDNSIEFIYAPLDDDYTVP